MYVGSGTSRVGGLDTRLRHYHRDNLCVMSQYTRQARASGYEITQVKVLARIPLPAPAQEPSHRTLITAIEAWLAQALACHRPGLKHLALPEGWKGDEMSYTGLCTHSAFWDKVVGDHFIPADVLTKRAVDYQRYVYDSHNDRRRDRYANDAEYRRSHLDSGRRSRQKPDVKAKRNATKRAWRARRKAAGFRKT